MLSDRYKFSKNPILKLNPLQFKTRDILADKIVNKTYCFEKVHCVVCGNPSEFEILAEKDRYGLDNVVVTCKKCGLVQTNPRFDQLSYNRFYKEDYRALYDGELKATDIFFRQQYYRGTIIYKLISRFKEFSSLTKPFVLEVGCGAGGILKVFHEHGCQVKGIDLGEEYMQYGKEKHGLDLQEGTVNNLKLDIKPDLVIYSNVLEHMTDPVAELKSVKRLIAPDGLLFIEVPGIKNIHSNYRSDFLLYLQNAHTYHFSLTSLKNIFSLSGFEVLFGDEYIRTVSKIFTGNNPSSIANDFEDVINYLKSAESKRKYYAFTLGGIKEALMSRGLKIADAIGIRGVLRKWRQGASK